MGKRVAGPKCVFGFTFVKEDIDPRVAELWPKQPVPFGDLRRTWRLEHCATVNPYWDSEMCPYTVSECGLAFLSVVQSATVQGTRNPSGRFRTIAKLEGLRRLEDKPLAREREIGPQGPREYRALSGDPGAGSPHHATGGPADPEVGLHRARTRPTPIGEMLRLLDLGSRQGPTDDGQEGTV